MATALLVLGVVGIFCTANALRPRVRGSWFAVPSFFVAWPVGELAPQVIVLQALGALVLILLGALDSWPGWVGLGLGLVSWAGLAVLVRQAGRTDDLVEVALRAGLGDVPVVSHARSASLLRLATALPLPDKRVEVVRDLRYADGAGKRHLLDVYRPAAAAEQPPLAGAPVLVQVHGGAWIIGDKRQQALPLMHHLAANGWVCVAPNYRLSPKATFPDHLVDVKLALKWVREHVAEYGGDPSFVVITGGSAGGHLASLVALTAGDPEYQPGFEEVDTSVVACIPFYGAYDLLGRHGGRGADGMYGGAARWLMKADPVADRAAFERASPLDRIGPQAPPFMVVHGTLDSLVPIAEGRAFAAGLREQSTEPVVYLELPGAEHAFEVFHSIRSEATVRGVHRFLEHVRTTHRSPRLD
ncbi:MAG: alpha/beta hydrolase [Acidimicrobiia bacterium]